MVHARRHDPIAEHIEIGTKYFVAMPFDAAKYRHAHIRFDVPQPQRMVFAGRQQQMRFFRIEFQLVDGVTVANVVFVTNE